MIILMLITACALPVPCKATSRSVPAYPQVESFTIGFNDETIQGFCLLIDSRTPEEKSKDGSCSTRVLKLSEQKYRKYTLRSESV